MMPALLKKDFKLAFSNPLHIGLITVFPIIIILLFGFTMDNYLKNEFGTFEDAKVFYYEDNPSAEISDKFAEISGMISEKIGVEFVKVNNYDAACSRVEESEAFSVIKLSQNGFDYFRSEFNETNGGDIVRSLFVQLSENGLNSDVTVQNVVLDVEKPNADVYYTFAGLSLALMFMGVIISNSYSRDFGSGTFTRISMSKAGLPNIILSKLICGIVCGTIQIAIAIAVSTLVFGIKWETNLGFIIAVFMALLIFSLCLGSLLGTLIKKETVSYVAVCICAMLSSYLGGSVTPVYLLEKLPVLKYVLKISPVYWSNKSLSILYSGINDETTRNCLIVLMALSVIFIAVTVFSVSNVKMGARITLKTEEAGQ